MRHRTVFVLPLVEDPWLVRAVKRRVSALVGRIALVNPASKGKSKGVLAFFVIASEVACARKAGYERSKLFAIKGHMRSTDSP